MCAATLVSQAVPGHTHTCVRDHESGNHMCSDPSCRRWFGVAS